MYADILESAASTPGYAIAPKVIDLRRRYL
jgi:hypothetical protein